MKIKLVSIDEVQDFELENYKQSFYISKEIMHGSNHLTSFKDLSKWRKQIARLEKKPTKNKSQIKQFFIKDSIDELVGMIDFKSTLTSYSQIEGGHISYSIRKESRGNGYAISALKEVIEYVKNESDLHRVLLTCRTDNIASKQVLLTCGAKFDKEIIFNNQPIEHYWISIKSEN